MLFKSFRLKSLKVNISQQNTTIHKTDHTYQSAQKNDKLYLNLPFNILYYSNMQIIPPFPSFTIRESVFLIFFWASCGICKILLFNPSFTKL